jgi:hypothetical protein
LGVHGDDGLGLESEGLVGLAVAGATRSLARKAGSSPEFVGERGYFFASLSREGKG